MAVFKVIHEDEGLIIKYKRNRLEEINEREVQFFHSKLIGGFMRFSIKGKRKIVYTSVSGITLSEYLKQGLLKQDIFLILAQINELVKKIEMYGLNGGNVVWDLQYTFINEYTKEVHFIYQPFIRVINYGMSDIFTFIHKMIAETVFKTKKDMEMRDDLLDIFRQMREYSVEQVQQFITKVCPEVYEKMRRSQLGKSQTLHGADWNYYEDKLKIQEEEKRELSSRAIKEPGTVEWAEPETSRFVEPQTTCWRNGEAETIAFEQTAAALEAKEQGIGTAYLIRIQRNEQIKIDKPVFCIGRDERNTDYFVAYNDAVSSIHASIRRQGGCYYIMDHHSTNGTCVNGIWIASNQEVKISNHDIITLGDEGFEFCVEQ